MKLKSLEIVEYRGVRNLFLNFDQNNACIYGPNGTGKSAVVDAIEFLFTGKLTRFTGEGTSGLNEKEHAKHIDASIKDSYVKAIVVLDDKEYTLLRKLDRPSEIIYKKGKREELEKSLNYASRRYFVLLRKNLLQFINSKGSTRAESIQKLLNIEDVGNIRKHLVKFRNEQNRIVKETENSIRQIKMSIAQSLEIIDYDNELILKKINLLRAKLGWYEIDNVKSNILNEGMLLSEISDGKTALNTTSIRECLSKIRSIIDLSEVDLIMGEIRDFIYSIESFLGVEENKDYALLEEFLRRGIKLIDESGECPFCDTKWDPDKLTEKIREKLEKSRKNSEQIDSIKYKSSQIKSKLKELINLIALLFPKLCDLEVQTELSESIKSWESNLLNASRILETPFECNSLINMRHHLEKEVIFPVDAETSLNEIEDAVNLLKQEKTPEQKAWDELNILSFTLKILAEKEKELESQKSKLNNANTIINVFIKARNRVLDDLFESITERFCNLYSSMHGEDERNFSAKMKYSDSAIEIMVDFHERGLFLPQAFHSEGHQDSMGLCLYLVLAEKLAGNSFKIIVLDDVLMSVDAGHRRQFSYLLQSQFPGIQFVITTHDKIWSKQLENVGVINSKNSIEFAYWNLETGPIVKESAIEKWELIDNFLETNNMPSAAHTLRISTEEFLSTVCENIGAKVEYRSDSRWSIGELADSAITRYKKILKDSIAAIQSWGDIEKKDEVEKYKIHFDDAVNKKNVDNWIINPSVHYNEWARFSRNDFQPVVAAYKEFISLFKCNECNTIVAISKTKGESSAICCRCGKINYNLQKKV